MDEKKLHVLDDEKDILMDHAYDGIQELNHPLPSWWLATWYSCIGFGVLYFLYYVVVGGPTLKEEYEMKLKVVNEKKAAYLESLGGFEMDVYEAKYKVAGIEKGRAVWEENCVACHLEKGQGDIGPNLTDSYWLYADGKPEGIYPIVSNGKEDNGMPAWKEVLSKEEMYAVTAFVMTLKNTNIPGKEPEGHEVKD